MEELSSNVRMAFIFLIGLNLSACALHTDQVKRSLSSTTADSTESRLGYSLDCKTQGKFEQLEVYAVVESGTSLSHFKAWSYERGVGTETTSGDSAVSAIRLDDTRAYALKQVNLSEVKGVPIPAPALAFDLGEGNQILLPPSFEKSIFNADSGTPVIKGSLLEYDPHDMDETSDYLPMICTVQSEYVPQ